MRFISQNCNINCQFWEINLQLRVIKSNFEGKKDYVLRIATLYLAIASLYHNSDFMTRNSEFISHNSKKIIRIARYKLAITRKKVRIVRRKLAIARKNLICEKKSRNDLLYFLFSGGNGLPHIDDHQAFTLKYHSDGWRHRRNGFVFLLKPESMTSMTYAIITESMKWSIINKMNTLSVVSPVSADTCDNCTGACSSICCWPESHLVLTTTNMIMNYDLCYIWCSYPCRAHRFTFTNALTQTEKVKLMGI